jgi:peptidoglycan/LPS O-acetylase OafA/YrhL
VATAILSKNYYPALDGMRALAIILVFLYHFHVPLVGVERMGWIGVDMFFVLSGFLITGILFDSRHESHRFRDFYMRRVLRIFPLYYGVWIALLVASPIFHWRWDARFLLHPFHLGNYARYVFFDPLEPGHMDLIVNGSRHFKYALGSIQIGHFWSLCVEEQFYLVWPAIVFSTLSQRALLRVCCWGTLGTFCLRWLLFYEAPHAWIASDFVYRFTWTRIDSFLIGGALALAIRGPERAWLSRNWRRIVWPAHATFLLFYAWCLSLRLEPSAMTTVPFIAIPGFTLIGLWAASLILHATEPESVVYRVLTITPLRRIGAISYGLYVFHFALFVPYLAVGLAISARWHVYTGAAVAAVGTWILASLSYRYYERPFLRLKSHFGHQVHEAPLAAYET